MLSVSSKLNVHVLEFPESSVDEKLMTVSEFTRLPTAGDCIKVGELSQLSVVDTKLEKSIIVNSQF